MADIWETFDYVYNIETSTKSHREAASDPKEDPKEEHQEEDPSTTALEVTSVRTTDLRENQSVSTAAGSESIGASGK